MRVEEQAGLTITHCLREIEERLARASAIANAAVTGAEAGHEREAVRIVLDLEELTGGANHLLGMATLMNRMQREHTWPPP